MEESELHQVETLDRSEREKMTQIFIAQAILETTTATFLLYDQ